MGLLRTTYFKKTSAVIFLALLVFVHAIKALHTHEISLACPHHHTNKGDTDVKRDFSCTICDFQLAKNCDAVISIAELCPLKQTIIHTCNYILPVYNSAVENSSGTDPPFFA